MRIIRYVLDRCLPTRQNFLSSSSSRQMTQVPGESSSRIHRRQNLKYLFVISFRLSHPIWNHLSWSGGFLYNTVWRLQKPVLVSLWSLLPLFIGFCFLHFLLILCCSSASSFFFSFSYIHLPLMHLSVSLIFCSLFCYFIFFRPIFPSTRTFRIPPFIFLHLCRPK